MWPDRSNQVIPSLPLLCMVSTVVSGRIWSCLTIIGPARPCLSLSCLAQPALPGAALLYYAWCCPAWPCPSLSCPSVSNPARPYPALPDLSGAVRHCLTLPMSCLTLSGPVWSCPALLGPARPCLVLLCSTLPAQSREGWMDCHLLMDNSLSESKWYSSSQQSETKKSTASCCTR